jgi:beta-galactosidase
MASRSLFFFALLIPGLTSGVFAIPTLPPDHKDTLITTLASTMSNTPTATHPSSAPITLRILNPSATPLRNILLEWSLQISGAITKKGKTHIPTLAPNQPTLVRLPLRLPDDSAGESFLQLRYSSAPPAAPHTLSDQQLILKPYRPRLTITPAGEITLSVENDIFTIHSPTIRISFNRQTGWLVHYEIKGIDLLDDTLGLRSNFWWPGYNDSAWSPADSGWQTATREPHLQLFSNTTSPEQIIIRTEYTLPATASLLHLSYTINAGGEMLITQHVEPDTTQPPSRQWPLPCFGMQWILPAGYDSITAYGPLAADTTQTTGVPPNSTWIGIFHDRPLTPSTSDPHAHATATRTELRWWTITDKNGNGLQFIADTPLLNESALHNPPSRSQVQISIDRPAQTSPAVLPMGNYRYAFEVKPLVSSTPL